MSFAQCDGTFAGSLRQLLRTQTTADHSKVDRRFSELIDGSAAGYARFLLLSAAALFPLEQALSDGHVERLLPDWQRRSRVPALRADLADLGLEPPPITDCPALDDEPSQFGALYVLEGSRLGAKVLIRKLLAASGRLPPSALRYLRQGEGLPLWRTFLERLESSGAARRSPMDAIAGARLAFACFGADADIRPVQAVAQVGT